MELECVRTISPGWPAARVLTWSRRPDAAIPHDTLATSLESLSGGGAYVWYFQDLLVIARVVEVHEVFESGTTELRDHAARARQELNRSLERIRRHRANAAAAGTPQPGP